ncbi:MULTISPECIES: DUF4041 domain-containing protein [Arthrobacter]|uniref:DUF4041 domain-containing protein n=2 Tax=Arthrobacter TaxID=1663 RepID=A0ABN2NZZ7_9MICC|nr:DUF4041 domain-containing protein [Arthrobacter sp. Edens01]
MGSDMQTPAGWYPDGQNPQIVRWWDGQQWTQHTQPIQHPGVPDTGSSVPPSTSQETVGTPESTDRTRTGPGRKKVGLFNARQVAQEQLAENERLQRLIDAHGLQDLAEISRLREEAEEQLRRLRSEFQAEMAAAGREREAIQQELAVARREIVSIHDQAGLQDAGLFAYSHPAESSAELAAELEVVRSQIKDMVRSKAAITATSNFTFNNSAKQGQKFVAQMSQIMLRAYNAEAENCVKTVKAGNLQTAQARLSKAREQIMRQGTMIDLAVSPEYHRLRLIELSLASRHLQALQAEKEAERERKAELREQRRVEQELAQAKEKLEKELNHYQTTLAALEAKGDADGAARMRELVLDAERAIADVDYRAANIRAGYVYVISNVGAFGENMVKIGMTRRLEPMDRVRELGDASVPFTFDVHALFFAEDAVGVEAMLHRTFAEQRVNKINTRREFFYVNPTQVLEALKQHRVEVVEFRTDYVAEEFQLSRGNLEAKM